MVQLKFTGSCWTCLVNQNVHIFNWTFVQQSSEVVKMFISVFLHLISWLVTRKIYFIIIILWLERSSSLWLTYLDPEMYEGRFCQTIREFIPGCPDPVFSFRKSVTGPLSRFLHHSGIWCPVCARMPPLHSEVCFWLCTCISCLSHTPTHPCTQTITCYTFRHLSTSELQWCVVTLSVSS